MYPYHPVYAVSRDAYIFIGLLMLIRFRHIINLLLLCSCQDLGKKYNA